MRTALYDPAHFNDRLLLGLKGTMSEAELHVLRARLRGGIAEQGAPRRARASAAGGPRLRRPGPRGPRSRSAGPGQRPPVLRDLPAHRHGHATVKRFPRAGSALPAPCRSGPRKGEIVWEPLDLARACSASCTIRATPAPSPSAAAAGGSSPTAASTRNACRASSGWRCSRTRTRATSPGRSTSRSSTACARTPRPTAPIAATAPRAKGPALLAGAGRLRRVRRRMTVRYHHRRARPSCPPTYCQRHRPAARRADLPEHLGAAIDAAVGELLVATVTPLALEVALAVQQEIQAPTRRGGSTAPPAGRARPVRGRPRAPALPARRSRQPPGRRRARSRLEPQAPRARRRAGDYERQRQADRATLDDAQRQEILALATDFPALWQDPRTPAARAQAHGRAPPRGRHAAPGRAGHAPRPLPRRRDDHADSPPAAAMASPHHIAAGAGPDRPLLERSTPMRRSRRHSTRRGSRPAPVSPSPA